MRVPVSHARQQLAELMRRAQAGEDVVLTLRGQSPVRLVPITSGGNDRTVLTHLASKSGPISSGES
jgi:prevent-host-death family protein